jgi:hypothetical protein
MKAKKKMKDFDCLATKWQVQEIIYNEIKDMSNKEICEYFQASIEKSSLYDWWNAAKSKTTGSLAEFS